MWPIGHGAVAYICYSLSTRSRSDPAPDALAVVLVGLGSQFPDLFDKTLTWYANVLPAGRSMFHSLLVLIPLVTILYLLARRRGKAEYGFAFGLGVLSHPLADAAPALWGDTNVNFLLWPLLPLDLTEGDPTILELLRSSMSDPYFLVEFLLLCVALALWRTDGYPGLELVWPSKEPR